MKTALGFILLFTFLEAYAVELKVYRKSKLQHMDRSFVLHTKSTPDQVVLDCQSFIQGINIGKAEDAVLFMMDAQDCEDLYHRIDGSLRKSQKHCIEVDDEVRGDYSCS